VSVAEVPIDRRHRCIFVHVPRTAGSSIEEALLGLDTTGPARDVSNEQAFFGLIPADVRARRDIAAAYREWQHLPAAELKRVLPTEIWDGYFKFAFVRNPWDRMVSWFCYADALASRPAAPGRRLIGALQERLGRTPSLRERFGAWLRDPDRSAGFLADGRILRDQLDWIADERGAGLVDFVGRYENLREDFQALCRRFGVDIALPHVRRSERAPLAEYYDDETREIVRQRHRRDIEAFGYAFEG
jgi:hypothetical protein